MAHWVAKRPWQAVHEVGMHIGVEGPLREPELQRCCCLGAQHWQTEARPLRHTSCHHLLTSLHDDACCVTPRQLCQPRIKEGTIVTHLYVCNGRHTSFL